MAECTALVLAAGRGQRAGGPKAWQTYRGVPLVQAHVAFLAGLGLPVVVTVGADELARGAALGATVIPVDSDRSPLFSLQSALRVIDAGWVSMHHVDMPVWDTSVWRSMRLAAQQTSAEALVPTVDARGGHPVWLSPALRATILGLDADRDRLDVFLRGRRVERVPVTATCVLENWNDGIPS